MQQRPSCAPPFVSDACLPICTYSALPRHTTSTQLAVTPMKPRPLQKSEHGESNALLQGNMTASGHVILSFRHDCSFAYRHVFTVNSTAAHWHGKVWSLTGQDQLRPSSHGPAGILSGSLGSEQGCSASKHPLVSGANTIGTCYSRKCRIGKPGP